MYMDSIEFFPSSDNKCLRTNKKCNNILLNYNHQSGLKCTKEIENNDSTKISISVNIPKDKEIKSKVLSNNDLISLPKERELPVLSKYRSSDPIPIPTRRKNINDPSIIDLPAARNKINRSKSYIQLHIDDNSEELYYSSDLVFPPQDPPSNNNNNINHFNNLWNNCQFSPSSYERYEINKNFYF